MKNEINGHLIRIFENETVSTTGCINLNTFRLVADYTAITSDMGGLVSEYFETIDGDRYIICPVCHEYALKPVMVPDSVGNGLSEDLEYPLCAKFE